MSTPILATKLYIPPPRPTLVLRSRLLARLNEGLGRGQNFGRKLTLVSAPAGFGKTTLVSAWLSELSSNAKGDVRGVDPQSRIGNQVAWLSLDEGDKELTRFLSYLVAALQTVAPQLGKDALARLHAAQQPPVESILTALLNEIAGTQDKFILVLDDYHLLDVQPIDHALTFLVDHMPPQMHVVITTREDPPLPLARYRARGQLTELRAADLRFTQAEAANFFNEAMALALRAEDIEALATRTEGWIAGLQMAALALQGPALQDPALQDPALQDPALQDSTAHDARDVPKFISAFAGDDQYIADYLVDEVLQQQPEEVRSFLLQTAILDRLSGSLCDAVTEGADSEKMLAALERRNLFVVPLDDKRQWYRYHHLFADVLQARAMAEEPDKLPHLHQRASAWYAANELSVAAIGHALAAKDFPHAADLIELARPTIERGRRDSTFLGWVKALPNELICTRPVLNVGYALALLDAGELNDAATRLQSVEEWLEAGGTSAEDTPEMRIVDDAQLQALPASVAIGRVLHTLASGNIAGTINYAEQALGHLPTTDDLRRGQIIGLLGLAHWTNGDLEAAQQAMLDAGALTQKAGTLLDTIAGIFVVADIQMARGQLRAAVGTYEHALQLAAEYGEATPLGLENVYSGLSDLYGEQGDLAAAAQALATSQTLGEQYGDRVWRCRWGLAQARIKVALGDLDGALNALNEVEHLYLLNPLSHVHPVAAIRTRIWLKQGRLTAALAWARERGLTVEDDLSYAREFEHITLARLCIAQYQHEPDKNGGTDETIAEAKELLERLLQAAEEGGRMGNVIEILILQAIAHAAAGDTPAAVVALARGLTLAEPEGYVRVFVDEGPPIEQLLREAVSQKIMPSYASKLLTAFTSSPQDPVTSPPHPTTTSASPQPLIEPLSARELEVLHLLKTELSGPEIADELVVALSTVRTHTKSIYGKLNVNNRRSAVKRAEELELI